MRKGNIVRYENVNDAKWNDGFGFEFEVAEKCKNVVKLISIKNTRFGIVATVPLTKVTLIRK